MNPRTLKNRFFMRLSMIEYKLIGVIINTSEKVNTWAWTRYEARYTNPDIRAREIDLPHWDTDIPF